MGVAVGPTVGDGTLMGLCSGVGVAFGVDVDRVLGVGDDRSVLVSIAGIVLFACIECEVESANKDMAMMQTTIRQVIIVPIHLHLKREFALFVLKGLVYADVGILASGFVAIASASELCASG